jgi:hypothetical protein
VEDQDDHGNNEKYVNETAADIGEQAKKPENCDDDGYPKQHENFFLLFVNENPEWKSCRCARTFGLPPA